MEETIKSFLRVFKKLPEEITESNEFSVMPDVGVVFNNVEETYEDVVRAAISRIFPVSKAFSNTFHSSWHDVFEKSDEELYIDQILHYLTTYGMEYLNIDTNGYIYLPKEIHKDPELRKYFYLQTISKEEAIEKLKSMLSGIALSERTIDDILEIFSFYEEEIDVESIKNKDMRIKAFSKLRIVPESPDECMKVINYLLTGKLTFVKNGSDLYLFRTCQRTEDRAFIERILEKRIDSLATIFFIYKKYIISLKHISEKTRKSVNKIRRRANYLREQRFNHEFLSTKILRGDVSPDDVDFNKYSIYDLVKIYNKVSYELWKEDDAEVYRIRNGKIFIKVSEEKEKQSAFYYGYIAGWLQAIISRIAERLQSWNYRLKLPENIDLAFPESEKAFIGEIPIYSIISPDDASVIGVSWKGQEDLDLSIITPTRKFGWNAGWRDAGDILFSGDMTRGGSESFYLDEPNEPMLLKLNDFRTNGEIEYDLFFANSDKSVWKDEGKHYTIDRNDVIYSTKLTINNEQQIIGAYTQDKNFIFIGLSDGNGNVSGINALTSHLINYFESMSLGCLYLEDVFPVYDEAEQFIEGEEPAIIDLEKDLSKATIIDLCTEKKDEQQNVRPS